MFAIILFYACRKLMHTEDDMFTDRLIYTCRKLTRTEDVYRQTDQYLQEVNAYRRYVYRQTDFYLQEVNSHRRCLLTD